jgi:glycosyltransferase involved in cell wall biosynthesis
VTAEERDERAATWVVKDRGAAGVVADHLATLCVRPLGYASGIAAAVRLAGADLRRLAYHLFYFGEAVVAGRRLARVGCSHVHTHYATTVALLAARVFGLELSASIHGSAEFIDPRAQRLREKVAACAFVRAISSYGRSQVMLAAPVAEWPKVELVRLGVELDRFRPTAQRGAPSPFRLTSVGQLQPAKGYHLLLDALAALVAAGHDVTLTLAGDGPDRGALEAHARSAGIDGRVVFAGEVNQDEVRRLFAETDAFVLPSFAEGIPVVLMEAMASGLACVATRITGVPELVADGESGLLVTPADEHELAAAIHRLKADDALRARIGRAARARVEASYDIARNVRALAAVFERRLAPGPAAAVAAVGRVSSES